MMEQPRTNNKLVGFKVESKSFLEAVKSGRLHHAWLISGGKGIGKATFCYKLAKYLLANYKLNYDKIEYDATSEVVRKIEALSHPDLFVVDSEETDKSTITVEEIRNIGKFLSLTSIESDRRVVIIDAIDDMNRNAANALLKILEEPSDKVIFLLVCHQLGKVIPTIRSRCRILKVKPMDEQAFSTIVREHFPQVSMFDLPYLYEVSNGSIGKVASLLDADNLALYKKVSEVMETQNKQDIKMLAGYANDKEKWEVISYAIERTLQQHLIMNALSTSEDLDSQVSKMEKIKKMIVESELFHLDKGQLVTAILS
jgi:DNA polymerase-3 subunit delta'